MLNLSPDRRSRVERPTLSCYNAPHSVRRPRCGTCGTAPWPHQKGADADVSQAERPAFSLLRLESCTSARHQLSLSFRLDDLRFSTTIWYADVDLADLERLYGTQFMHKVYFHIAAFEANKLASLRPERFDLGPFRRFYTREFEQLWRTIFQKVWAQWRYENRLPDYQGPLITGDPADPVPAAAEVQPGPVDVLFFCGGGKDSLVGMKLLERARIPYSSLTYSHSIYGSASFQHELIGQLLNCCTPVSRHRQWVYDDFLDSPVLEIHRESGIRTLTAAETPSSVFAALPIVLRHGYRYLAIGHERSADTGNMIWDLTGEEINHQWGKSVEAEVLLSRYICRELIGNVSYFSLLKPIYDVLIFNLLERDLDALGYTHSCNIRKPWCCRCPKCAYVWLNYMAYLPVERVDPIFRCNLLNLPENDLSYRQMLGLENHTPFECIGQIGEVRLAFELCRRKGLSGQAMDSFRKEVKVTDWTQVARHYLTVDASAAALPPEFRTMIVPQMESAGQAAWNRLEFLLK
jgi:hypothetical protein